MPRGRDRIVEETDRQVDMQPRAIAGLAIGINRATVPHSLQRLDASCDHPARGLAIGGGDQANPARVALGFRIIHAFAGKALMFGSREVMGHVFAVSGRGDLMSWRPSHPLFR